MVSACSGMASQSRLRQPSSNGVKGLVKRLRKSLNNGGRVRIYQKLSVAECLVQKLPGVEAIEAAGFELFDDLRFAHAEIHRHMGVLWMMIFPVGGATAVCAAMKSNHLVAMHIGTG